LANATSGAPDFQSQLAETLASLDTALQAVESNRARLISVQVLLADIESRSVFDEVWLAWIGDDPAAWPQRVCLQVALAPGLLVEIVAVAAV
jgi:enamine deaminase RidA (YjgF/YER057c/UK114 family)